MISIQHSTFPALEIKTLLQQEFLRYGILWNGFHTLSFSHSDQDILHTLFAYSEILPFIHDVLYNGNIREMIHGKILEPVFRKTTHFHSKPHLVHG